MSRPSGLKLIRRMTDSGNLRLFSPVMLDFCFQCGFIHILVIKGGKRRSTLRATTSLLFLILDPPMVELVLTGTSRWVLMGLILLALPVR